MSGDTQYLKEPCDATRGKLDTQISNLKGGGLVKENLYHMQSKMPISTIIAISSLRNFIHVGASDKAEEY